MATARNGNPEAFPPRRVVLLGASNLTRAIGTVVETAGRMCGRPLDVLAAFGHGRSYGLRKGILGHQRPGIAESGLWKALAARPPAPTAALVTDIGNDLLYEAPVPEIAGWVERCLDRIQEAATRVVMTALPLGNLAGLSRRRYLVMRTILFPGSRLPLGTLSAWAEDLDRRLRDLASRRGVSLVEHRPQWYGFDPIHLKRRHWPAAWREILAPWAEAPPPDEPARRSLRRWLYFRLLSPEQRWFLGWERRNAQPAGRLPDGTTLSFY